MRGVDTSGVVQPFMGLVGDERVEINKDANPVESPVTVANSINKVF